MLASLSVSDLSMAFLTPVMLGLSVCQTKRTSMKIGGELGNFKPKNIDQHLSITLIGRL
jgi:hypothetical protein